MVRKLQLGAGEREVATRILDTQKTMVTIGIDDSNESDYTVAFPVLQERGMRGTFFENGNLLGEDEPERELDRVTEEQLAEMAKHGQEIACHGWNHENFENLSIEEVKEEIKKNVEKLSEVTGQRILTHAYPYGNHTKEVRNLAGGFFEAARVVTDTIPENPFTDTSRWGYFGNRLTLYGSTDRWLYNVPARSIDSKDRWEDWEEWVDPILDLPEPAWVNMFCHGIYDDELDDEEYFIESHFIDMMDYLSELKKENKIEIVPFYEGARRIRNFVSRYYL